jgi:hypothetical protein
MNPHPRPVFSGVSAQPPQATLFFIAESATEKGSQAE